MRLVPAQVKGHGGAGHIFSAAVPLPAPATLPVPAVMPAALPVHGSSSFSYQHQWSSAHASVAMWMAGGMAYSFYPATMSGYLPNYSTRRNYYPRQALPDEDKHAVKVPTASSSEALAQARAALDEGDAKFAKRRYAAAISSYKRAARAAPELAEPHLRQALAMLAMRKYGPARQEFFESLELGGGNDGTPAPAVEKLSTSGDFEKTTKVLERLAAIDPLDAEIALALGIQLYCGGQREQAAKYFNRAASLGADKQRLLMRFLPDAPTSSSTE